MSLFEGIPEKTLRELAYTDEQMQRLQADLRVLLVKHCHPDTKISDINALAVGMSNTLAELYLEYRVDEYNKKRDNDYDEKQP